MTSPIETWVSDFVNSRAFMAKMETAIENADPKDRARYLLELLSYVMPKVKGVDPLTPDQQVTDIQVHYSEVKPPKVAKPPKAK